jgi:hypothetical protein
MSEGGRARLVQAPASSRGPSAVVRLLIIMAPAGPDGVSFIDIVSTDRIGCGWIALRVAHNPTATASNMLGARRSEANAPFFRYASTQEDVQ